MTWFTKLIGIEKETPEQVRRESSIEGDQIVCPDGKRFAFGRLETPKLSELRQTVSQLDVPAHPSTIREHVGDVRQLHADSANANALFHVASQFNLLEMTGPSVTPERGVGIYENDPTQGPACAIACGAGTIYRNYFAPVGDRTGQSADHQVDCSADLGQKLGNQDGQLWQMQIALNDKLTSFVFRTVTSAKLSCYRWSRSIDIAAHVRQIERSLATRTATRLAASNEKKQTPGFPSTVTYVGTFSSRNRLKPGIGGHHLGAMFDISLTTPLTNRIPWEKITPGSSPPNQTNL